jgi:alpha-galactosidase
MPSTNYGDSLNVLNDALSGVNTFEMVFDQYISAEAGSYLLLKSKLPGGYTASVKVNEKDPFIDSVETDPLVFKDTRLSFKWALKNNEALYVPVPVAVTSANGLNK